MAGWDFLFNANAAPDDPRSAQALLMRQKIALAMIGRDRKGYPKNIGEGLTAIGDALGERSQLAAAQNQLAAYEKYQRANPPPDAASLLNARPPAAAPAAAAPPGAQSSAPDTSVPTQEVAAAAPPEEGGYNFIDAQAGGRFGPTPGYLQDAIATREPDPDMQAYYGSLSGTEAPKGARDVSPTGAAGPYQFTQGTGARYGVAGNARFDPGASTDAVRAFTADNAAAFQQAKGRPPTFAELAVMHQQGPGGGMALLSGQSAPARNLAVNNMAGFSPAAAVAKMNRFYGMPNEVASVGGPPPDTAVADAAGAARLNDVVGLEKGDTGAYAYPRTASRGDVQSDVPEVGITGTSGKTGAAAADTVMQARERLARQLLLQQTPPPAPGVPPVNPTLPGVVALPPSSTTPLPAVGPSPNADIRAAPAGPIPVPGAQMAQAGPGPAPSIPQINRVTPPVTMPPPGPVPDQPEQAPYNKAQLEGMRRKQMGIQLQDPVMTQQGEFLLQQGDAKRAQDNADNKAAWEAKILTERQRREGQEAAERGAGLAQQQLTKATAEAAAASEAAKITEKTGMPAQLVHEELTKRLASGNADVSLLRNARIARQALNSGVVYGMGADFKIDLERAKALWGNIPASELASRSEMLAATTRAMVKYGLNQYQPGDPRVTNSDLIAGTSITGGDPSQQLQTRKELVNMVLEDSHKRINEYERYHHWAVGGLKPEEGYRLRTDPISEDPQLASQFISRLLQNADNKVYRDKFDERFGKGAAQLEIDRAQRARSK